MGNTILKCLLRAPRVTHYALYNWHYANWHYANWHYANWHYANWHYANWHYANWQYANSQERDYVFVFYVVEISAFTVTVPSN